MNALARLKTWSKSEGFKKYSRNAGWLILGRVITLVVSFFTTIYIARTLGPTNYGQLSYALSFVGIFSFIYSLGIDQVLYRDLVRFPDQRNTYLGTAFWLRAGAAVLATIICIGFAFGGSERDVSLIMIVVIASTFIFNAFAVINYEFQAQVESKKLAVIGAISSLTLNIAKVLVIFFGEGVLYLAIIYACESILYAILYVIYRTRRFGSIFNWRFDRKVAFGMLRDSWPILFASAFALIYVRIDQVMIKNLIDTASVGVYDAAVRIAEVWHFIPNAIASSVFPAIVNAKSVSEGVYQQRLIRLIVILVAIAIAIALPIVFLSDFIMQMLYGVEFVSGAGVLSIYVWGGIGMSLGLISSFYLVTENKRTLMFVSSLLTMLVNIVLNLILIPKYGIVGSAWATFISYLLLGLPLLLLFRKKKYE